LRYQVCDGTQWKIRKLIAEPKGKKELDKIENNKKRDRAGQQDMGKAGATLSDTVRAYMKKCKTHEDANTKKDRQQKEGQKKEPENEKTGGNKKKRDMKEQNQNAGQKKN
jgi:hypothetical protein